MIKIDKEQKELRFENRENVKIEKEHIVRVKKMNAILELRAIEYYSQGLIDIKKFDKDRYLNLTTGELSYYDKSKNRGESLKSLKRTFAKIRDLINNNFVGSKNELHCILTYRDNMQDTKQLLNDFKAFWQRLKRKYGDNMDYITVVEPQGRGAWHHHLLIRLNEDREFYIPSADLEKIWSHGFVKIRNLKNVDNIGAYLSAYLADIEVNDDYSSDNVMEKFVDGKKKKFKKGGRLHFYPSNMNLYRKSKGIKFPEIEEMTYEDIKKIVGDKPPTFTKTTDIILNDKRINSVTYEQYNLKR